MSSVPARVGRYEIVDRLGEGGMGVVYLATDPQLQRTVAIKMLLGQSGETDARKQLRQRFAREASSAAALRHHHIVTIYDVGEDEGRPFIAMEFLDGESMAQVIARQAPLELQYKLRLIRELCSGLGYAHRRGIIHRDIKPANLMITGEGSLKILDFGLARATSSVTNADLTQAGTLMGTPYYMSPEQILGKPLDHRSDIFAVGVVLYEILAYQRAFEAETPHLVLLRILQGDATPIRNVMPEIGPGLERIVAKAMAKDPESRYQSLEVLATDLDQFASPSNSVLAGATMPLDGATIEMPVASRTAAGTTAGAGSSVPAKPGAAPWVDATIVVRANEPATAKPAPKRASSRRSMFVLVAVVIGIISVLAVYLFVAPGRTPRGVAGPAAFPPAAPVTNGASESTDGSVATRPDRHEPATVAPTTTAPATDGSAPAATDLSGGPAARKRAPTPLRASGEAAPAEVPSTTEAAPVSVQAPQRAAPARGVPRSAEVAARCNQLNERAGLGEALTPAEREFIAQQCRN